MRINRCGYLIREGFRSIATHGFMSFASVAIIVACLIIMGTVSLLAVNIDALIEQLEDQNEVVAFVDETITDEEAAKSLGDSITSIDNVESVEFVNRHEAMDSFMSQHDEYLQEGIDETVFRHRFIIHLVDISLMKETKTALESVQGIAKVKAHTEYADKFVVIRNVVTIISLVLIVILVFVSGFIMSNTIKLATFGRREEIGIMKMVGATNSFIRMPFVIEGLVLGVIGGGLAFLAQWGLYELITDNLLSSIGGSLITAVSFSTVSIKVFVVYIGTGVLVGAFGGVNAIKNYLKV